MMIVFSYFLPSERGDCWNPPRSFFRPCDLSFFCKVGKKPFRVLVLRFWCLLVVSFPARSFRRSGISILFRSPNAFPPVVLSRLGCCFSMSPGLGSAKICRNGFNIPSRKGFFPRRYWRIPLQMSPSSADQKNVSFSTTSYRGEGPFFFLSRRTLALLKLVLLRKAFPFLPQEHSLVAPHFKKILV